MTGIKLPWNLASAWVSTCRHQHHPPIHRILTHILPFPHSSHPTFFRSPLCVFLCYVYWTCGIHDVRHILSSALLCSISNCNKAQSANTRQALQQGRCQCAAAVGQASLTIPRHSHLHLVGEAVMQQQTASRMPWAEQPTFLETAAALSMGNSACLPTDDMSARKYVLSSPPLHQTNRPDTVHFDCASKPLDGNCVSYTLAKTVRPMPLLGGDNCSLKRRCRRGTHACVTNTGAAAPGLVPIQPAIWSIKDHADAVWRFRQPGRAK